MCFCSWHRVAWSVYNENVQMWVDCKPVRDLQLTRDMSTTFSLRGVFVFGKQAGEEVDVFEVNMLKEFHNVTTTV